MTARRYYCPRCEAVIYEDPLGWRDCPHCGWSEQHPEDLAPVDAEPAPGGPVDSRSQGAGSALRS